MLAELCTVVPSWEYLPDYDPTPSTGQQGVKALWYEGAESQKNAQKYAKCYFVELKGVVGGIPLITNTTLIEKTH